MSPVTHLLLSWSAGSAFPFAKKDRLLVAAAGVVPDLDGMGLLWDLWANRGATGDLALWAGFHHVLGHNIAFCLLLVACACFLASRTALACLAVFLAFHLHLACDLAGSRGPDQVWSIPYLLPFSTSGDLAWSGQWPLNSWQNMVITVIALAFVCFTAWKKGVSPLEIFSSRANAAFVHALRNRFGSPPDQRILEDQ
jgi:hypothetical protein